MNVATAPLSEVAEFVNGFAFKPEDWGEAGLRIIRIQNLTDPTKPFNRTMCKVKDSLRVRPGDLLVSWSATLGVFEWNEPDDALVNQHIFRVIPDSSKVDKTYLRYALEAAITTMEQHVHGATMKHINRKEFLGSRIPLPPIEEQRRIAAVLDAADALRAKRRQALARLDSLTQSIFIDMFGDPLSATSATITMEEIAEFVGGGTPSKSVPEYYTGGICWATSKDMKSHLLRDTQDHITEEAIANSATKLVPPGTVLVVVKSKVLAHRLPVAISVVPTCFGQDLKGLIPAEGVSPEFIATSLRVGERWLLRRALGVNTEGLTLAQLRDLPVPDAHLSDVRMFTEECKQVEGLRADVERSLTAVGVLFTSLQQRAFRGEL